MVLQRSVESPSSYISNSKKEDVVWDWIPEKQAWNTCSDPEESPKENLNIPSNCTSFVFPGSNVQCKRRKLHGNSLIVFAETAHFDELDRDSLQKKTACGSGDRVESLKLQSRQCDGDVILTNQEPKPAYKSWRTRSSNDGKSPDSEPEASIDDSQSRDICIALLRSDGFPLTDGSTSNSFTVSTNSCQSCEACGNLESIADMIICDGCEEAFHVSCSGATQEALDADEWFCQSCSKLDGKACGDLESIADMIICDGCEEAFHVACSGATKEALDADEWFCQSCSKLNGKYVLGTPHVRSQIKRGWSLGSIHRLGPIACMLKYPDYTSKVRVGDHFQAIVPEWHDKTTEDSDSFCEPIEMDPIETLGLHGCAKDSLLKPNSVSNWLQCQEILDDQLSGAICGKWRRAPFSEVQTNDWDCSCALPWDPFHADCVVPQEMETGKVLAQLKYVEQLKSRLTAKKRK